MTHADLLRRRLRQQRVSSPLPDAAAVVGWLGAVQAQDYPAGKWAVGLRTRGATDQRVESAIEAGEILRTHVLRPTWHFVRASDIRWMLDLTAPRVKAGMAFFNRYHGLDERLFRRSETALRRAFDGTPYLTRQEIGAALRRARVLKAGDDSLRLIGLIMRAELDAVICSGPRAGKQFTYALLDARVPSPSSLAIDEARAELARRYFISHGPATLKDFAWWSGLTVASARQGLDAIAGGLDKETVGGTTFWSDRTTPHGRPRFEAHLLPCYDECLLSYRDESAAPDQRGGGTRCPREYGPTIVVDGRIAGTWARTFERERVVITLKPYAPLTRRAVAAIGEAAERYGRFLGQRILLLSTASRPTELNRRIRR